MFCPNCRTEYKEGITTCADCGATLVAELPPDDFERSELVTIYRSHELSEIAIAKSILEEAGIEFASKGSMSKELLAVGPVELQVNRADAEQARELLYALSEDLPPEDFIEPMPDEGDTEDEGKGRE
ncbi:MAG: hypothetical protein A2W25_17535 [candidate division Zixibacteria bacterium RBG_16_53_22]|nr:MAG: hypothetical protein A2W25_17535 [candidate division Zixibacteria bacterium RBG_16_53_22]